MTKMRVHELAKELGIENKELIEILQKKNVEVKNHMSSLEDSVADETIFQDIEKLSDYRIKVPEGLQLTKIASNAVFSKPSLNPVKSSNNQRQKNGGMRQRMRK